MKLAAAGALYFAVVFAVGFAFGAVRELFLTPRFGLFTATLAEAPVMLLTSFLAARWIIARQRQPGMIERFAIGGWGLAILLAVELASSVLLRDMTAGAWLQHFLTPQGVLSLALFAAFAVMPVLVRSGR